LIADCQYGIRGDRVPVAGTGYTALLLLLHLHACVYRQLIVQHYKVYYPVRHHLIQHIVNSVQKLGLTPNVSGSLQTLNLYVGIYFFRRLSC